MEIEGIPQQVVSGTMGTSGKNIFRAGGGHCPSNSSPTVAIHRSRSLLYLSHFPATTLALVIRQQQQKLGEILEAEEEGERSGRAIFDRIFRRLLMGGDPSFLSFFLPPSLSLSFGGKKPFLHHRDSYLLFLFPVH